MADDMPGSIANQTCVPCHGGVTPLTPAEAETLRAETPDWAFQDEGRRIERRFRFKTFKQAFAFVQEVAALAEAEGHHPDITFGWGYATVSLHTHAIEGLHRNDFIVASKIDRLSL